MSNGTFIVRKLQKNKKVKPNKYGQAQYFNFIHCCALTLGHFYFQNINSDGTEIIAGKCEMKKRKINFENQQNTIRYYIDEVKQMQT